MTSETTQTEAAPTTVRSAQAPEIRPATTYSRPEVTTMTTTSYPFLSKNQIKARLAAEPAFVRQCALVMQDRQTAYEQATLTTKDRNRQGWMSSHAVFGGRMAAKIRAGEAFADGEWDRLSEMVSHYGKQLASHFRQEAIEANPALKAAAAVFGV